MRLIKVGRSSACDIVLPSENVSSLHAEIIVLDSGEVLLTDKNSSNGTYVGGKRITPNTDVPVRRGDLVVIADTELSWSRVPKPENLDAYKIVVNLGTNHRNDIQLTSEFCSRFHAVMKVDKKNNVFIRDLNSKNGVKVNGLRIGANKDVKIKRGDSIICADEDVTEDLKRYIPDNKALKWGGLAAACLVGLGIIGFLISVISNGDGDIWPWSGGRCKYHKPGCERLVSHPQMAPSVVLVQVCYHFTLEFEDCSIPGWDGALEFGEDVWISGTGFFVDNKGNIATNRHVAMPWEYKKTDFKQGIVSDFDLYCAGIEEIKNQRHLDRFLNTEVGKMVYNIDACNTLPKLNRVYTLLRSGQFKVSGRPLAYYLAYPFRNYTELSEMDKCDFIADSGTESQDIAIIQRNVKSTPAGLKYFDINLIRTDRLVPQAEQLYTIGYPYGMALGYDHQTKEVRPTTKQLTCSRDPSQYTFEIQGSAVGGQSGSPVFDDFGHLVGIVSSGITEAQTIRAVQAVCLKNLYDREANK